MKKILLLIVPVLLLTGCNRKECIKSHKEQSICTRPIPVGKTVAVMTVPCEKTICDEYKEVEK